MLFRSRTMDERNALQRVGFAHFPAAHAAIDHLVKKPQHIRQINPKPAVQTARKEPAIHERIVPLDHHEPFAFQTTHTVASIVSLPESIEDNR